jgi:aspartokinase
MAGTLTISTLSDGTSSTSATDIVKGSARAWVNFNGIPTVAIRASYNVSSVTRNGAGDYTVNFTNAMVDANYSVQIMASSNNNGGISIYYSDTRATTNTRVSAGYQPYIGPAGFYDCNTVMVTVNR